MDKWPTIKYVEGENPWITYFKKQIFKKNNCINSICTGGPGKGKSWGMLSLFCQYNPDFDMNEQCFFKARELIKAFRTDKIVKGRAFLFDESGIDANSLKWQDEINRGLNAFFQTARHKNYVFGMTVPFTSFVSKGVRTLMNCHFRAEGWTSDNMTKLKPLVLEWNDEMNKFYKKRLVVQSKGNIDYCNEIKLPKPPKNIVKEYEKRKLEFTQDLYKEIESKIKIKDENDMKKMEFVKCSNLAREIDISVNTMLSWIHEGRVEARKIGSNWFMTKEAKEKLLNEQGNVDFATKRKRFVPSVKTNNVLI